MKKVLAFGAFDPLHEGHINYLQQAKQLGDYLMVVVGHDSAVRAHLGYDPEYSQQERARAIEKLDLVDEVILGNEMANMYQVLGEHEFDVVALGYNQYPSDEDVREHLDQHGKQRVEIVRLKPYKPYKYKSTYINREADNE